MKKDDNEFLRHILEAILLIEEDTDNLTKEEALSNKTKRDAIVYRLIIIGEAAKNLSDDFKNLHTEINWKDLAAVRDVMAHKYFSIDLEIVWGIIKKELPNVKLEISKLLNR